MSGMTNYLEEKVYDHVLRNTTYTSPATLYLALHTGDPGETGATDEVSTGSYARQTIAFSAPTDGAGTNSGTVTFSGMPAVTVTHLSLWDAVSGGNCLLKGSLTTPKACDAGDSIIFSAAQVTGTFA